MKKILALIVVFVSLFCFNVKAIELPKVTGQDKVIIYLFYGKSCGHCHDFIKYFLAHKEYDDYFEIVAYETWANDNNKKLASYMRTYFEVEGSGVPFIVIGDNYKRGFSYSYAEDIINEAINQYKNNSFNDVVKKTIKELNLDFVSETLEEAAVTSGLIDKIIVEEEPKEEVPKEEIDTNDEVLENSEIINDNKSFQNKNQEEVSFVDKLIYVELVVLVIVLLITFIKGRKKNI